jgi:hypothetical protein
LLNWLKSWTPMVIDWPKSWAPTAIEWSKSWTPAAAGKLLPRPAATARKNVQASNLGVDMPHAGGVR